MCLNFIRMSNMCNTILIMSDFFKPNLFSSPEPEVIKPSDKAAEVVDAKPKAEGEAAA